MGRPVRRLCRGPERCPRAFENGTLTSTASVTQHGRKQKMSWRLVERTASRCEPLRDLRLPLPATPVHDERFGDACTPWSGSTPPRRSESWRTGAALTEAEILPVRRAAWQNVVGVQVVYQEDDLASIGSHKNPASVTAQSEQKGTRDPGFCQDRGIQAGDRTRSRPAEDITDVDSLLCAPPAVAAQGSDATTLARGSSKKFKKCCDRRQPQTDRLARTLARSGKWTLTRR